MTIKKIKSTSKATRRWRKFRGTMQMVQYMNQLDADARLHHAPLRWPVKLNREAKTIVNIISMHLPRELAAFAAYKNGNFFDARRAEYKKWEMNRHVGIALCFRRKKYNRDLQEAASEEAREEIEEQYLDDVAYFESLRQ